MGEEFYHKSSKFEEFIAPFRSLSIIKYNVNKVIQVTINNNNELWILSQDMGLFKDRKNEVITAAYVNEILPEQFKTAFLYPNLNQHEYNNQEGIQGALCNEIILHIQTIIEHQ
ncbi:hypothetical protein RhiirA1_449127 [Rhizophagus irregularis]|uniref:Uncharacterized protein n=1 Tax=Rhizophagus irregularis TaxID=588596 RepID=A0A2N0SHW1_9GLOM|nr:hypothetical protein RhiirA1_449127 [Rhizophagus irregularis]